MYRFLFATLLLTMLGGCASTYYDPADPYIRGIRYFDRRDFNMARATWQPLAQAGDCDAEYRMGSLSFFGVGGVPKSYSDAFQAWQSASSRGHAFSQALLATIYAHDVMEISTPVMQSWFNCEKGCGQERNMFRAYIWMSLAERFTPYADAKKSSQAKAAEYRKFLSANELLEADREIQGWQPAPPVCQQRLIR